MGDRVHEVLLMQGCGIWWRSFGVRFCSFVSVVVFVSFPVLRDKQEEGTPGGRWNSRNQLHQQDYEDGGW